MIRGLYTSGWSMITLQQKMDVVSNNMANVSTTGFKKDALSLEAFPDMMMQRIYDRNDLPVNRRIGAISLFNDLAQVKTNFTQGILEDTGRSTDLALDGDENAFFSVAVAQEDGSFAEFYTRGGAFQVTADGVLVTKNGDFVMGENGLIRVPGPDFLVRGDGTVETAEGPVDRLKIRKVENPWSLRKIGENLIAVTDETVDGLFEGNVVQGRLEMSNVESVREMVDMISVLRAYEANQRMIQYQDATLEKACNEIGRLR